MVHLSVHFIGIGILIRFRFLWRVQHKGLVLPLSKESFQRRELSLEKNFQEHLRVKEPDYVELLADPFTSFVDNSSSFLCPWVTVSHHTVNICLIFDSAHWLSQFDCFCHCQWARCRLNHVWLLQTIKSRIRWSSEKELCDEPLHKTSRAEQAEHWTGKQPESFKETTNISQKVQKVVYGSLVVHLLHISLNIEWKERISKFILLQRAGL